MRRRYPGLRSALATELRALLEPFHHEGWPGGPLEAGDAILRRFTLLAIDFDPEGLFVEFGLNEGWDDAGFRVGLSGWAPKGLGVDD